MSPLAARLTVGLLGLSTILGAAAWAVQSEAEGLLERAIAVQEEPVPPAEGEPPALEEYRDVVGALEESIALRQEIDDLLSRVEELVGSLREQQGSAADVTASAGERLEEIGRILGSARHSARSSGGRLSGLADTLGLTPRLARLIAEELEEMDRRFGPSVGGSP